MTQNTNTLRLTIDAAAAKSGAREFTGAINAIKSSINALERDSSGMFAKLKTAAERSIRPNLNGLKETQTSLKATASASQRMADTIKRTQLSAAAAMSTSAMDAHRLHSRLKELGDVSGISALNVEVAKLQRGLRSAKTGLDVRATRTAYKAESDSLKRRATDLEKSANASKVASAATRAHATELEALKNKYNPIYAASKQYETALNEISRAEQQGALSAGVAEQARTRAAASLTMATGQMQRYGTVTRMSNFHTANVTAQFNDIGMMMASGQSPLILAMQQGTQLSQVLNQMAGSGGVLAALKAGFMQMINPISLITIGAIAAGAALFQFASKNLGAFRDFSDVLKDTKESMQEAASAAQNVRGYAKMRQQYGEVTQAVKDLIKAKGDLKRMNAKEGLEELVGELRVNTLTTDRTDTKRLIHLGKLWGVTASSVRTYREVMNQTVNDGSIESMADAMRFLRAQITGAAANTDGMTDSQKEMVQQLLEAEGLAREFMNLDMSQGVNGATDAAGRLADKLGISLGLARQLASIGNDSRQTSQGFENNDPRAPHNNRKGVWTGGYSTSSDWDKAPTKTKTTGGGTGLREYDDELTRVLARVLESNTALSAMQQGLFETDAAAQLYARAMADGAGSIDANTLAQIQNLDALTKTNEELRNTPDSMGTQLESGVKNGLRQALRDGLNGKAPIQSLVNSIQNSLTNAIADSLTNKLISGLGIDKMFGIGGNVAATQMQTAMVVGGNIAAANMATAITTGSATATATSSAGGVMGFLGGIFGFAEGGYSDRAGMSRYTVPISAFANAPSYAQGTANTSGGIPAILHPNEAVVPLSRGRKIPVEGGSKGGSVSFENNIEVKVDGDVNAENATALAESIAESLESKIDEQIAMATMHGGALNLRGGAG